MSAGPVTPLSPFVRGTTDAHVYFVQTDVRRRVPDDATLKFMAGGQAVRTLSDADLQAIELSTPLPSRANGTLMSAKTAIHCRCRSSTLCPPGSGVVSPTSARLRE